MKFLTLGIILGLFVGPTMLISWLIGRGFNLERVVSVRLLCVFLRQTALTMVLTPSNVEQNVSENLQCHQYGCIDWVQMNRLADLRLLAVGFLAD